MFPFYIGDMQLIKLFGKRWYSERWFFEEQNFIKNLDFNSNMNNHSRVGFLIPLFNY